MSQAYASHDAYRKKHGLESGQRVFICKGERSAIVREALLRRGWFENVDTDLRYSHCYDLKWTIKRASAEQDFGKVPRTQLLNHFPKKGCVELGSKSALLRNLQEHFTGNRSALAALMPRTFSLASSVELSDFIQNYAVTYAEALLRSMLLAGEASWNSTSPRTKMASLVLKRFMDVRRTKTNVIKGHDEWTVLLGGPLRHPRCLLVFGRPMAGCEGKDKEQSTDVANCVGEISFDEVEMLLAQLPTDFQPSINGTEGIWILKTPHQTRGRGMRVLRDLVEILNEAEAHGWNTIVQKYIERPLLLGGAKCDVRVWALVTSWAPRCVLFAYPEPYINKCLKAFSLAPGSLNDEEVHIGCQGVDRPLSELFGSLPDIESRWHEHSWPRICESIRAAVGSVADAAFIYAVPKAGAAEEHQGPASFELFGFDFILSDNLDPWLLEANTSPGMVHCHEVDAGLSRAVDGMLDIVLGLHENTVVLPQVGGRVSGWELLTNSGLDPKDALQRFYTKGAWPCTGGHGHIEVVREALYPRDESALSSGPRSKSAGHARASVVLPSISPNASSLQAVGSKSQRKCSQSAGGLAMKVSGTQIRRGCSQPAGNVSLQAGARIRRGYSPPASSKHK